MRRSTTVLSLPLQLVFPGLKTLAMNTKALQHRRGFSATKEQRTFIKYKKELGPGLKMFPLTANVLLQPLTEQQDRWG